MSVIKRPLVLDAGGPGGMAILQIIRQALPNVTVVACDMDQYSPAQAFAQHFIQVPPADHPTYADNVRKVIEQYNIDLVIPSFHFGHQALAQLKNKAFINNFEASLICHDKFKFYEWCKQHHYRVPETHLLSSVEKIQSKAYLKPRFGAGSTGNYLAATSDEFLLLKKLLADGQDYLVQEFIEGELWQVEALNLNGRMTASAACRSVRVKAGNTITAFVTGYSELQNVARDVLESMEYNGLSNLEAIRTEQGELVLIEVNPRSGSCIQYTTDAGCNTVAYLMTGDRKYLAPVTEGTYASYRNIARV